MSGRIKKPFQKIRKQWEINPRQRVKDSKKTYNRKNVVKYDITIDNKES